MAITRAQQVKQMLQDGGRIGLQVGGQSPGPRGQRGGSRTSPGSGSKTGGGGDNRDRRRTEQYKEAPKKTIKSGKDFRDTQKVEEAFTKETIFDKFPSTIGLVQNFSKFNPKLMKEFAKDNPKLLNFINSLDEEDQSSGKLASALNLIGYGDFLAEEKGLPALKYAGDVGGLETFVTERDELTDKPIKYDFRNVGGGEGRGGQPIIPQTMMASAPAVDNYYGPGGNPFLNRTAFRLLADGGFLDDEDYVGGGIMDASGRQQYFLGKLVKSAKKAVKGVTRAVKKVAKSPIGKAAILGGLTFGIPGVQSGFFSKGLMGTKFGLGAKNFLANTILGTPVGDFGTTRTGGLLGLIKDNPMLALAGGLTAAPFLFGQEDEGEKTQTLDRGERLDIPGLRARGMRFDPDLIPIRFAGSKFQFAADGGRIGLSNGTEAGGEVSKEIKKIYKNFKKMKAKGVDDDILKMNTDYKKNFDVLNKLYNQGFAEGSKEPVAKKTMPLLDMGGKEMDLREEGGFVPIGRMEKADDVPARLSKNEFVFTADAVRNAGDGNVDKGAEVMYNMMKNLEAGGDVSEESQGLKGARRMFETSQRLEEVL